jgi:hypothetical protein
MSETMSMKKEGALFVQKAEMTALPVIEPQTRWIDSVNKLLHVSPDPMGPSGGFAWPAQYEVPTRIPYVGFIDSGSERPED